MNLFRRLLPCAAACVLLPAAFAVAATPPIKALLVTGGCWHDYEAPKKILSEGLGARANVVPLAKSVGVESDTPQIVIGTNTRGLLWSVGRLTDPVEPAPGYGPAGS